MSEHFQWQLVQDRFPHADDQHLGYSFEDLYMEKADPVRDRMELAARELGKLKAEDLDRLMHLLSTLNRTGEKES